MRRILALTIAAVAVLAGTAWAQTQFTDVADDHPRTADVAYAVERGWLAGFEDGTFKPDQTVTAEQAAAVFDLVYPDGITRADFAAVLRAGHETLTVPGWNPVWCLNEADSECVITDAYWTAEGLVAEYTLTGQCSTRWVILVELLDGDGIRTGDHAQRTVTGSQPGDTLLVQVPDPDGDGWSWVEQIVCQSAQDSVGDAPEPSDTPDCQWWDYRVCLTRSYQLTRAGVNYVAWEFETRRPCFHLVTIQVAHMDGAGRETGDRGIETRAGFTSGRTTLTVLVPVHGAYPATAHITTYCS